MHSLLLVVGDGNLEEMMHPYWQEREVEEYCVGEVSDYDKRRVMQYYSNQDGVKYRSFASCYQKHGKAWNDNLYRKDENGVWQEYSRSNPNMKWDWYQVGGRWAGRLVLKEGAERIAPPSFSWGWDEEFKRKVLDAVPQRADIALLKDIANIDQLTAISVLKDGEWIDIDDYHGKPVKPYLEGVPEDTLITVVDYHM